MINWDLWNQAGQKLQNETRDLYDFSWVTPEVVKGFTRYQALRPESEVRNAEEYEKAREGLEDEVNRRREQQWRTKWEADRAAEELQKDLNSGDMYDDPGLVETELLPPDDPGMTDEERAELETEIMRERLGDRYDALKRSYDIYGKMNPYERMITAGKKSSYWDPEIGKIYTDAGEKIRNDRIQAWKEALEGESMLQKSAMDMFNKTNLSRYRREAEKRLGFITNLLENNPRLEGKWFNGYDTIAQTDPRVASAYGDLENMILNEGPMDEATLAALMEENGIRGEDATDLIQQNQNEWKKRYGVESEVVKNTEEAIRAQSETFKKDQTERVKNMNLLDDLRERLASKNASEADYRMAAETLRKLNLDISKSFDEKTARLIERAKATMVNNPSWKTIASYLVLTVGDKLGITPGDLNALTSDKEKTKLIRDAIDTLYDTDANMYEIERQNMEENLKGVPGINTSKLSWMQSRKALTPEDVGIGAVADTKGNFTITLPNGETDVWTSETVKEFPEFLKFFNGKRSRVRVKKGTTNILTDGRWEFNIDTNEMTEV